LKKISICIPSYKRPENIRRLLGSIAIQTFKDFEIVITDDSPDDSVKRVVDSFSELSILYFKNETALGTPANWNKGISLAKGDWIKIMHDDDWFRTSESLETFAQKTNENKAFIFSQYVTVFESGQERKSNFPLLWKDLIVNSPLTLLANNVIGAPSVTLINKNFAELYDERMKWRVDIDYYIRLLEKEKGYALINDYLVNIGMSESQVTNYSINNPQVELPEGLLLLKKYGIKPLKNAIVYDAWWRIVRNCNIRRKEQLYDYVPDGQWPKAIIEIVRHQSRVPAKFLKIGILSKLIMLLSRFLNRNIPNG
jgi:glycosyltransferase involved in cell wall biosynthesis